MGDHCRFDESVFDRLPSLSQEAGIESLPRVFFLWDNSE